MASGLLTIVGDRENFGRDIAGMAKHPQMSIAARLLAERLVAQFEYHPVLNLVVNDRAQLVMAWMALYFDACHDPADPLSGLTVNRFKAACQESGLCSRGRAAAMLGIMRFAGHIEPAHEMRKGYPLRFVPTEKLRTAQRLRLRNVFTAMAKVVPEGEPGLAGLGDVGFEKRFFRIACEELFARPRPMVFAPEMRTFTENKSGMMTLMALITSAPGQDMPDAETPMQMPVARLSARFSVSRAAVKQLLDRAAAEGLLIPAPREKAIWYLSPQLRRAFVTLLAGLFVIATHAIRGATAPAQIETALSDA